MSDFESEAWSKVQAAATPPEVAAETVEETVVEAAAEEPEVAAAAESAEIPVTEVEETEEVVTDEIVEPIEAPESADFTDLLDDIPTSESLLEKHKHLRLNQAVKDDFVKIVDGWKLDHDLVTKVGGEQGIRVLEPVLNLINTPEAGRDEAQAAIKMLLPENPRAVMALAAEAALFYLTDESRQMGYGGVGDAMLESVFGVNAERINQYILLDKAGIIDMENDLALAQQGDSGSTLFQSQQDEIKRLKEALSEKDKQIANPVQPKEQVEATTVFTQSFDQKVTDAIAPFLERGKWAADSPLAKLATNALLAELRNEPEYAAAMKHIAQSGSETFPVTQAVTTLVNKAKARINNYVRDINTQFKARPSVTEKIAEKVTNTKPKSETLTTTPRNPMPVTSADSFEDEAYKRAVAAGAFA